MSNIDVIQPDRDGDFFTNYGSLDMSANPSRVGYFDEGWNNDSQETDPTIAWPEIEFWTGTIGATTATWKFPTRFQATHCSLIPKGRHQGRLLLWNTLPVIARCPSVDGKAWWSWQAWVILDTDPNAAIRSRNYLLPVGPVRVDGAVEWYPSLFCAGQCWTDNGDLLVAGGNEYNSNYQFGAYQGLWIWNPDRDGSIYYRNDVGTNYLATWNGTTHKHYFDSGAWVRAENMQFKRWYPSPKLTQKFATAASSPWNGARCGVLIFGGQNNMASLDPNDNPAWNSYEAVAVTASPTATTSGLTFDLRGSPIPKVFQGPGVAVDPFNDWMYFYPCMHLLSTGGMFMAGYTPQSATLTNHGVSPGSWTRLTGNTLPVSGLLNLERQYCMTFMVPDFDGVVDRVVRVGGYHYRPTASEPYLQQTTETCEWIAAGTNGANWALFPPLDVPRTEGNLVITPDADVYLFGGVNRTVNNVTFEATQEWSSKPLLIRHKSGGTAGMQDAWELLAWSPSEAFRDYHSTSMLMPTGQVFTGGGESSDTAIDPLHPSHAHNPSSSDHPGYDYEMWSPRYLRPNPDPLVVFRRPENLEISGGAVTQDADGTYVLSRGTAYTVSWDPLTQYRSVTHVVLMAPGSTTHHNDFCHRYHKPTTQSVVSATQRSVTLPASDSLLPDGYYMLFAISDQGVPSEAVWVRI